jgi:hypothetical protein
MQIKQAALLSHAEVGKQRIHVILLAHRIRGQSRNDRAEALPAPRPADRAFRCSVLVAGGECIRRCAEQLATALATAPWSCCLKRGSEA